MKISIFKKKFNIFSKKSNVFNRKNYIYTDYTSTYSEETLRKEYEELQKQLRIPSKYIMYCMPCYACGREMFGIVDKNLSTNYTEVELLNMLAEAVNERRKRIAIGKRIAEIREELGMNN